MAASDLRAFEITVAGRDTGGAFLLALTVVADSLPSAQAMLDMHATTNGWSVLAIEEVEQLGSVDAATPAGIRAQTGKAYVYEK